MRFKRIFLCAVMAGCLSVPVSAEPLPTVELISVMDAVKPAIPKELDLSNVLSEHLVSS